MPDHGTMFCLRCGYALDGVVDNRCPECARPFRPEKPRTFGTTPRDRFLAHRTLLALFLGILVVVTAIVGGYLLCVLVGFWVFPGSNIAPVPFLLTLWPFVIAVGIVLACWLVSLAVKQ